MLYLRQRIVSVNVKMALLPIAAAVFFYNPNCKLLFELTTDETDWHNLKASDFEMIFGSDIMNFISTTLYGRSNFKVLYSVNIFAIQISVNFRKLAQGISFSPISSFLKLTFEKVFSGLNGSTSTVTSCKFTLFWKFFLAAIYSIELSAEKWGLHGPMFPAGSDEFFSFYQLGPLRTFVICNWPGPGGIWKNLATSQVTRDNLKSQQPRNQREADD